ncbi:MAG: DNA-deoxyinosine glycosylase [Allosphingosinicella sp.]|uniref:DNA-deoxyinosine glycosylase n=1 Tax=Allosphingosinicella sp. TaxID=2823234 RepID=UPI00395FDEEF
MDDLVHRSFPPVVRPDSRLLILGSLPGVRSLAQGRYYAHPRNQFWRLAGAVAEREDLPALGYEARLDALLDAGIGLWDTVGAARRQGSLDTAIRLEAANDLAALIAALPRLRAIGFNGGTSSRIGRVALGGTSDGIALVDLPSSSPAYTLPFDEKRARWMALAAFL